VVVGVVTGMSGGGVTVIMGGVVVVVVVVVVTLNRHRNRSRGSSHKKHNDHQQLQPLAAGTGKRATLPAPHPTYL